MSKVLSWDKTRPSGQAIYTASGNCLSFEIKGFYDLILLDHDLTLKCFTMNEAKSLANRINRMSLSDKWLYIKWRKFTRALLIAKQFVLTQIRKLINSPLSL